MQVALSPHGEELLEAALARGLGRSPEEIVERALETIAREVRAFGERHHVTLGPGERLKDLLHGGHKF